MTLKTSRPILPNPLIATRMDPILLVGTEHTEGFLRPILCRVRILSAVGGSVNRWAADFRAENARRFVERRSSSRSAATPHKASALRRSGTEAMHCGAIPLDCAVVRPYD
jgi:hypothetical protein